MSEVLAGALQGGEDPILESTAAVVALDLNARIGHGEVSSAWLVLSAPQQS
jgi:hypothetical protein